MHIRSTPKPPANLPQRVTEIRAAQNGPGFEGYASHFWSVDSYYTVMKPGAFKKTVAERGAKTPILWQHDSWSPIGRPTELKEDKTGLYFNAHISEGTTYGKDAMALLRDDVPLGMSFGFQTIRSRSATDDDPLEWGTYKGKAADIEVIEEVRLWEISLVTFAANEQATISHVRRIEPGTLSTLIEQMRAGTLSGDLEALVADLVAAHQERAAAGASQATTAPAVIPARPRIRQADAALALALHGIPTGVTL